MRDQIHAAWRFFLSVFKHNWELSDYPVVIREHEVDPTLAGTRLKQHRYTASIVNWWVITGGGETEREALQELEKSLANARVERARAHKNLPRPGSHVPIEYASRQRVSAHSELAEDFIHRVLNLEWAWISDESSLWDFHGDENNEALVARIKEIYGVDVSDIQAAKLSEILERIATQRQNNVVND